MPPLCDDNLLHFRDDPEGLMKLADVILVAEGQKFPAHSHILATHSAFYRKMFIDLESQDRKLGMKIVRTAKKRVLPLGTGIHAKDVRLLLSWLYEASRSEISRKVKTTRCA